MQLTSLDLAQITGRKHNHILYDIRRRGLNYIPLNRLMKNGRTYVFYAIETTDFTNLVSIYTAEKSKKISASKRMGKDKG